MSSPIPKETALELCEEIRKNNSQKLIGIGKIQCYFCWRFGKKQYEAGDPTGLCIFADDNLRGCSQVNKLFDDRQN